ncbi:Protein-ribulosamine 3-kinase [Fusarium keratoplasticum]|uniref:Protein-ribulosamine 3-kinase n=1 Tax=Fusarium keratoplasticum TaxID=1328300 RepID=A0ACC0R3V5_9HYPO|nr:Protein-ribulosamine 3-kinase [Fusarium keratoplasticum]KAI8674559.1 Protein-ribulosamine 3-kinase [Fusarium keratoplasticum]
MSQDYWQVQNNPKVHEGPVELDEGIISRLPPGAIVEGCEGHGKSNWNTTARVDLDIQGSQLSYFLKASISFTWLAVDRYSSTMQRREGPNARPMFQGEYESMKLINKIIPDFSPTPVAWGKLRNSDGYFILFSFHDLGEDKPPIPLFTQVVAQLHTLSIDANPTGKFGFHMATYNGTLKQDNTWTDTWEEFYARGMRHMLKLEEEARGLSEELQQLSGPFFDKVIPRLLRPLETGGRSIKPVLLHGDLWLGNVSTQAESENPLLFDASAFWGHNEYELATLRLLRNDWAKECLKSYHEHFPKSEPENDWEARNSLYSTLVLSLPRRPISLVLLT